ncbi:MAG: hypothetical protein QXS17_03935 [Candidatus Micrarchaeaceae archaeon]
MDIAITRSEEREIEKSKGWLLVYGRRKVGKTFLLRKSANWDYYLLALKTGQMLSEKPGEAAMVQGGEAIDEAVRLLKSGKNVIVDEFQRLSEAQWSALALAHPNGRLFASGSSYKMVGEIFERRSPMLGLLAPLRLDIISYADAASGLANAGFDRRKALLWGAFARDPWVLPMLDQSKDLAGEIARILPYLCLAAEGLVGEVFEEEDKALTMLYDSVIRLVAEGIWKPAEIAGILSSTGLISGGLPTIAGILDKLAKMGLVEKIPLWNVKGARFYYRINSPVLSIAYYLDQKYRIAESGVEVQKPVIESLIGKEVERAISNLLSQYKGLRGAYTIAKDGDIDVVLLDKKAKNPLAAYEVKIGEISTAEAHKAIERIHSAGIADVGLVSLSKKPGEVKGANELLGPDELFDIINASLHNARG